MPLLWLPSYSLGEKYNFPRSYYSGYVVGWLPGCTILASGRTTILQEHVYGGYKLFLTFKEKAWVWSSNRYTHDWVIEDYYATFPGDDTPISAGGVVVGQSYDIDHLSYYMSFLQSGWTNLYWFQFPTASSGYWKPPPLS